jgi:DNA replication initiation complex subunit (GINS family)
MPEDSKEVRTSEDYDHQLKDPVELNKKQGAHDGVALIVVLTKVIL